MDVQLAVLLTCLIREQRVADDCSEHNLAASGIFLLNSLAVFVTVASSCLVCQSKRAESFTNDVEQGSGSSSALAISCIIIICCP